MDDPERDLEDWKAASTIAGQADDDLEFESETHEWLEKEKIPHPTE